MIESLFIIFDKSARQTDKIRGYFRWLLIGIPALVGWWALWKAVQYMIEPDAYGNRGWFEIAVSGAWLVANATFSVICAAKWRRLDRWEFVLENMTRQASPAESQVNHDYFLHAGFDENGNDLGTHRVQGIADVTELKAQMKAEAAQLPPAEALAYWKRVERDYRKGGKAEKAIRLFALNQQKAPRAAIAKRSNADDGPSPIVLFNQ